MQIAKYLDMIQNLKMSNEVKLQFIDFNIANYQKEYEFDGIELEK